MINSGRIPEMFFLNGKLHKKIRVVRSDDSVVAWCYQDEKRNWYPRSLVKKQYKMAYTIPQAARLMNVKPSYIRQLIEKGLVPKPERAYDLASYRPGREYICQDDMLAVRQAAWDKLPKNRFGEPYRDTMLSEVELIHVMNTGDDREFVIEGDDVIRIFKQL